MSQTARTRVLVLRKVAYSNSSQIVTAFGRDEGIVTLLAKGALRPPRRSAPFPAPFDLAGWYDVVYRRGRGEVFLAVEGRLVEGFDHLRNDLSSYLDVCFALEVMAKMFSPADPHPEFLRGGLSYLKLLAIPGSRRALRVHFHNQLLRESGLGPAWGYCGECGTDEPGSGGTRGWAFRLPIGVLCSRCRRGADETRDPAVFHFLAGDADLPWGRVPGVRVAPEIIAEAWRMLRGALLYHLGRAPRSLRYQRD